MLGIGYIIDKVHNYFKFIETINMIFEFLYTDLETHVREELFTILDKL
jgi:hypothetical protein